ncbi:MAG: hypothetical protein U5J97_03460 [Trueperaceae bacterium]|nr:hypothetical protein [Trueperaceae bacterium]
MNGTSTTRWLLTRLAACMLTLLVLGAQCSSPGGPPGTDVASEPIGPGGGSVTSADGQLTLTVPPGALSTTETITIRALGAADLGPEFGGAGTAFDLQSAYELGPDGLEFAVPATVAVVSEQSAAGEDGALELAPEVLLTSDGGTAAPLEAMALEIDADGDVTVTGEIRHFTQLARYASGARVYIRGVALAQPVDLPFTAEVLVFQGQGEVLDAATYEDLSLPPVAITSHGRGVPVEIPDADSGLGTTFEGSFEYVCEASGRGIFWPEVALFYSVEVVNRPGLEWLTGGLRESFKKDVACRGSSHTITVDLGGDGTGRVTSDWPGIDCPPDCDETYPDLTRVTLTAEADPGSVFTGWDLCGTTPTCTLEADEDKRVTAFFSSEDGEAAIPLGVKDSPVPQPEAPFPLGPFGNFGPRSAGTAAASAAAVGAAGEPVAGRLEAAGIRRLHRSLPRRVRGRGRVRRRRPRHRRGPAGGVRVRQRSVLRSRGCQRGSSRT